MPGLLLNPAKESEPALKYIMDFQKMYMQLYWRDIKLKKFLLILIVAFIIQHAPHNCAAQEIPPTTEQQLENLTDLDMVEIEPEDPFADPGAAMITREMNQKLKAAINNLPPRCKLIFTLVKELYLNAW